MAANSLTAKVQTLFSDTDNPPESSRYDTASLLLNESFSFHHIQGDRVAVRIGLTHGCQVMRGNFTELGITLPIPPSLMKFLEDAERRQTLRRHHLP